MATAIIAYLVYLFIVIIINTAVIYHFSKYCFPGDMTRIVVLIYGIVMVAVPVMTLFLVGVIR